MAVADWRDQLTADAPRFVVDKPYSRLDVDRARIRAEPMIPAKASRIPLCR